MSRSDHSTNSWANKLAADAYPSVAKTLANIQFMFGSDVERTELAAMKISKDDLLSRLRTNQSSLDKWETANPTVCLPGLPPTTAKHTVDLPGLLPTTVNHMVDLPGLNRFTITKSMNLQDYDECFESHKLAIEAYPLDITKGTNIQVKHTKTRIATNNADLGNKAQVVSTGTRDGTPRLPPGIPSLECLQ